MNFSNWTIKNSSAQTRKEQGVVLQRRGWIHFLCFRGFDEIVCVCPQILGTCVVRAIAEPFCGLQKFLMFS